MRNLQPITWPAGAKSMDAWLSFLDDPERYKKLHSDLSENVATLNELIEKLQVAGDIDVAKAAAETDQQTAKLLLAETKEQAKEAKVNQAAEQTRLEKVAAALAQDIQLLKKAAATETVRVAKHEEAMAKAQATLEAQREKVARELAKARALQDKAQERLNRIEQFKEAV